MSDSDCSSPGETSSLLGSSPKDNEHTTPLPGKQLLALSSTFSSSNSKSNPHPSAAPPPPSFPKADTNLSWGEPAGLPIRPSNDENLLIFRRAIGINTTSTRFPSDPRSLEECRLKAQGIYLAIIQAQTSKKRLYQILATLIYLIYFLQIPISASLTALGPSAGDHQKLITALGAINTVLAGVLALLKGQGFPGKLKRRVDEMRKLQDWIEQTEALLVVGVLGRDRKEVGLLVQVVFKKYNAVKDSLLEEEEVGNGDFSVAGSFLRVSHGRGEEGRGSRGGVEVRVGGKGGRKRNRRERSGDRGCQ